MKLPDVSHIVNFTLRLSTMALVVNFSHWVARYAWKNKKISILNCTKETGVNWCVFKYHGTAASFFEVLDKSVWVNKENSLRIFSLLFLKVTTFKSWNLYNATSLLCAFLNLLQQLKAHFYLIIHKFGITLYLFYLYKFISKK